LPQLGASLARLLQLKDDGILTDEKFAAAKMRRSTASATRS
jgi:hypothetical protein